MNNTCTWSGCISAANHPQIAKDGEQWANLCDQHDKQLNDSITNFDAKKLLSCWVKAGGGAQKMAARMTRNLT